MFHTRGYLAMEATLETHVGTGSSKRIRIAPPPFEACGNNAPRVAGLSPEAIRTLLSFAIGCDGSRNPAPLLPRAAH